MQTLAMKAALNAAFMLRDAVTRTAGIEETAAGGHNNTIKACRYDRQERFELTELSALLRLSLCVSSCLMSGRLLQPRAHVTHSQTHSGTITPPAMALPQAATTLSVKAQNGYAPACAMVLVVSTTDTRQTLSPNFRQRLKFSPKGLERNQPINSIHASRSAPNPDRLAWKACGLVSTLFGSEHREAATKE